MNPKTFQSDLTKQMLFGTSQDNSQQNSQIGPLTSLSVVMLGKNPLEKLLLCISRVCDVHSEQTSNPLQSSLLGAAKPTTVSAPLKP